MNPNDYNAQRGHSGSALGAAFAKQVCDAQQFGAIGQTKLVATSLEQRLDHLHRAVERLGKLRNQLDGISDNLGASPEYGNQVGATPCPPPSTTLNGKFGDALSHVHTNIDAIEAIVTRIQETLFDASRIAQSPTRG